MVLTKSSDFFGTKVEGWLDEATAGPNSGMVSETSLSSFPSIFLEGTS